MVSLTAPFTRMVVHAAELLAKLDVAYVMTVSPSKSVSMQRVSPVQRRCHGPGRTGRPRRHRRKNFVLVVVRALEAAGVDDDLLLDERVLRERRLAEEQHERLRILRHPRQPTFAT